MLDKLTEPLGLFSALLFCLSMIIWIRHYITGRKTP